MATLRRYTKRSLVTYSKGVSDIACPKSIICIDLEINCLMYNGSNNKTIIAQKWYVYKLNAVGIMYQLTSVHIQGAMLRKIILCICDSVICNV